jgi:hypothetical protein
MDGSGNLGGNIIIMHDARLSLTVVLLRRTGISRIKVEVEGK